MSKEMRNIGYCPYSMLGYYICPVCGYIVMESLKEVKAQGIYCKNLCEGRKMAMTESAHAERARGEKIRAVGEILEILFRFNAVTQDSIMRMVAAAGDSEE